MMKHKFNDYCSTKSGTVIDKYHEAPIIPLFHLKLRMDFYRYFESPARLTCGLGNMCRSSDYRINRGVSPPPPQIYIWSLLGGEANSAINTVFNRVERLANISTIDFNSCVSHHWEQVKGGICKPIYHQRALTTMRMHNLTNNLNKNKWINYARRGAHVNLVPDLHPMYPGG